MKKFLILFATLFCTVAFAETITLNWFNKDGTINQTTTCNVGGNVVLPTAPTKYGYTFQGWIANYIPIEYIESTGTQYISLNVGINGQSKIIEAEAEYTEFLNYSIVLSNTNNTRMTCLQVDTENNNTWSGYIFSNIFRTSIPIQTYTKYKIKIHHESGNMRFYVDDNLIASSSSAYTVGNKFTFFANYSTNSFRYGNFSAVKMYNIKISDLDGNVLADFIPVLDGEGTPCMFDKVSGQFFYNQGTGDFIAGPVVGSGV